MCQEFMIMASNIQQKSNLKSLIILYHETIKHLLKMTRSSPTRIPFVSIDEKSSKISLWKEVKFFSTRKYESEILLKTFTS